MLPGKPLPVAQPAKESPALAPPSLPGVPAAQAPQFSFGQAAKQLALPALPLVLEPLKPVTLSSNTNVSAPPIVPPLVPPSTQQTPGISEVQASVAPSTERPFSFDAPSTIPAHTAPETTPSFGANVSPRKSNMATDVAAAILVEVLVGESVRIATRALAESALVRGQVVHATLTAVLYDKVLSTVARDLAKDLFAELKRTRRLQRWVFYRWRHFCGRNVAAKAQKKANEESLASRRTSFLSAVRDLTLAGDHSSPMLRLQQVRTFPRTLRAPHLDDNMDVSDSGRQTGVVEAGRLAREIHAAVANTPPEETDIFCKLVVSAPSLVAPRTSAEWNLVRWLREGFGFDPDDSHPGEQIDGLDAQVFVEPLVDVAFRTDMGTTTLHLLVQRIDSPQPPHELESPRPEEGFLTGPSGALFVLAPFETDGMQL
jgi:hypothetical protein